MNKKAQGRKWQARRLRAERKTVLEERFDDNAANTASPASKAAWLSDGRQDDNDAASAMPAFAGNTDYSAD